MELPSYLSSGEVARLFPVISETGKEQKATSILLSTLSAVPLLANSILSPLGVRVGTRTVVNTFTEVGFGKDTNGGSKDRPDGLIEVATGKRSWTALVEAKIGNAHLDQTQVERYLRLARDNGLNAVITISNEFAATPEHSPLKVSKILLRKLQLFHFSWRSILVDAVLLHEGGQLSDPEQAFLVREFIRFFSHDSAGVTGFNSMPSEWGAAIEQLQAGGVLQRKDLCHAIVGAWNQEVRDLSLIMSRMIGCRVAVKLSRQHIHDSELRMRDAEDGLCRFGRLEDFLIIPNAASDLRIVADLRARALRVSMSLNAPRDKKTTRARIAWLLRQLRDTEPENVTVGIVWASRATTSVYSLTELRDDMDSAAKNSPNSEVKGFEVTMMTMSARRFSGRRTFIEDLERLAPKFYEKIGQHLQSWVPVPPKPKHSVDEPSPTSSSEQERTFDVVQGTGGVTDNNETAGPAGNFHTDLLEVPDFLRRV